MFFLRVKELAKQRGIKNLYSELKKLNGFGDYRARKYMNAFVQKVNLRDLEILCIFLKCNMVDLIQWMPDDGADFNRYPFLQAHYHQMVRGIDELMKPLSHDEVEKVSLFLQRLREEAAN